MRTLMLIIAAMSLPAAAQTQIDLRTQAKSIDFTLASSTKPLKTGTVLPATCSIGALFYKTDAPAGQNLYGCTALDTWTEMSGGGNVRTDAVNTFTRGQNISGSQDQVQLDITGNATQTNPVFRVRTSGGANLIQANNDGSVDIGSGNGPNLLTNQAAPSTPASGRTAVWSDSTNKGLSVKDDAGTVSRTAVPHDCGSQGLQKFNPDGTFTCGGSGTAVSISTFGGVGTCATASFLKKITSGIFDSAYCDGAGNLTYLWNGRAISPASTLTLTSHLQSGVTVSATNGYEAMTTPASGTATVSYRTWAAPAAPYTQHVVAIPPAIAHSNANYANWSVGFADATGAQLGVFCGVGSSSMGGFWCAVRVMASGALVSEVVGAFAATTFSNALNIQSPIIILADNNTNVTLSLSLNGASSVPIYTESRTAHFGSGPTLFYYGALHSSADSVGDMVLVGVY